MSSPSADQAQPTTTTAALSNGHTQDLKGSEEDRSTAQHSAMPSTSTATKVPDSGGQQQPHPSFFQKFIRFLVPCISSSSSAHPIELPEAKTVAPSSNEKVSVSPTQPQAEQPATSSASEQQQPTTTDPSLPSSSIPTAIDTNLTTPPADPEVEVIIPPTPTTPHLLPPEETEGLTSGAVQPPGSKGDSPTAEKVHQQQHTHAHTTDNEDSEYTDDDLDEPEDDEERLIYNGGAGIPIGPDGVPRPLLPPISPAHAGRKCLVLDLDETLVHSSFKSIQQADYVVPVEIEYHWHNVYVIKRPGVDNFLKKMGEIYEVVVFTASLSKYADPVLDKLDIHQVVSHRLFRESCYNHKGNYVKDLSQLGRPIGDTIILDNSPASYIFHPNNAVPVSSWFNDPHDTELTDLVPFLADLAGVDDVRGILDGAR